jgi:hypothetical protein
MLASNRIAPSMYPGNFPVPALPFENRDFSIDDRALIWPAYCKPGLGDTVLLSVMALLYRIWCCLICLLRRRGSSCTGCRRSSASDAVRWHVTSSPESSDSDEVCCALAQVSGNSDALMADSYGRRRYLVRLGIGTAATQYRLLNRGSIPPSIAYSPSGYR